MNKYFRRFLLMAAVVLILLVLLLIIRGPRLSEIFAEKTAARVAELLSIDEIKSHLERIATDLDELDKSVKANRLEIRRMEPDFLVSFPLMFENAGLKADGKQLDFRKGEICPTEAHQKRLRQLVEAFKPCAKNSFVKFAVEGHSSTARFRDAHGKPVAATNELNLVVANERARGVGAYLKKLAREAGPDYGFEINIVEWQTFEQMRRPYLDNSAPLTGENQGALNRTVLVELHEAGACDLPPVVRNRVSLPVAGTDETAC